MGFDHLSALSLLAINFTLCLFIHLFLGAKMQSASERQRQNRRGERNQLLPMPLPKTSRVEDCLQKEDKRGRWPLKLSNLRRRGGEHPVTSSDMQPSLPPVQNRPLSHLKMGSSRFKRNQAYISD